MCCLLGVKKKAHIGCNSWKSKSIWIFHTLSAQEPNVWKSRGCAKKHWRATSEFSYILYLNVSIWERAHRKRLESGGETWKVTGRTGYPLHPSRPVGSFPVFLVNMLQFEALCWTCVQHNIGTCPQPPPTPRHRRLSPQLAAVRHCAQRVGGKAKKHSCFFFWRQRRKASLSLFLQFPDLLFKVPRWELSIASAPGKLNWQPDVFFSMKQNLSLLGNVNTVNLTYSGPEKKKVQEEFGQRARRWLMVFFFFQPEHSCSLSLSRPHRLFFQIPSKNRWSHSGTLMRPQWHSERWDVRHRPGPVSLMANQRCDPVWPLHAAVHNGGGRTPVKKCKSSPIRGGSSSTITSKCSPLKTTNVEGDFCRLIYHFLFNVQHTHQQ